jgi:hypothetical protein
VSAWTCNRCLRSSGRCGRSAICLTCHQAIRDAGARWCNRARHTYTAPSRWRRAYCPDCQRDAKPRYPTHIPGYVPLVVAAARAHVCPSTFRHRLSHGWPVKVRRTARANRTGRAWFVEDLPIYPPYTPRKRRSGPPVAAQRIVEGV